MIVYLADENGRYVQQLEGTADEIVSYTPKGYQTVVQAPQRQTDYWNGTAWIDIGSPPAYYMVFNYAVKDWVDGRDLQSAKTQRWQKIKVQRDIAEFSGFSYNGNIFDSDLQSQIRIVGAVILAKPTMWTLKDNTVIALTVEEVTDLGLALASHINTVHSRGRLARENILQATTIEQVEAVIF